MKPGAYSCLTASFSTFKAFLKFIVGWQAELITDVEYCFLLGQDPVVFNCQMGAGRTTTGMAIACLSRASDSGILFIYLLFYLFVFRFLSINLYIYFKE